MIDGDIMKLARDKVVPPLSGSIEQCLCSGKEIAAPFCSKEIACAFRIDSPAGAIDGYNWKRIIAPLASGAIPANDVCDQSTCIIHCRKIAGMETEARVCFRHVDGRLALCGKQPSLARIAIVGGGLVTILIVLWILSHALGFTI